MTVPNPLRLAVEELSTATGINFSVSEEMVTGTELYVVYACNHPLPDRYNQSSATLGFRVPKNYPDAQPEDSFFLSTPEALKLAVADPNRNSIDVHRASATSDFFRGTVLDGQQALVFSWHLWDRSPWSRRKHTLIDHYTHSIRRFDQPEHD